METGGQGTGFSSSQVTLKPTGHRILDITCSAPCSQKSSTCSKNPITLASKVTSQTACGNTAHTQTGKQLNREAATDESSGLYPSESPGEQGRFCRRGHWSSAGSNREVGSLHSEAGGQQLALLPTEKRPAFCRACGEQGLGPRGEPRRL